MPRSQSSEKVPPATALLGRSLRRTVVAGAAIAGLFFIGFGGWAAWAPLSGAAVASGVISPEGKRRSVQHLEGGIVHKLLVRNGSVVTAGQPLVELDANIVRARYDAQIEEYRMHLARQARLIAERNEASDVTFPAEQWGQYKADYGRQTFAAERDLFFSRREAREGQKQILHQRIAQHRDEIQGLEEQIASQATQLALIAEETNGIKDLVDKGHERRPRLLALQRTTAEISGARAGNRAAVARALSVIGETEARLNSLESDRREEIETQLSEVQANLAKKREELRATRDILDRTVIVAPVSGTVAELRVHTVGGVIAAGGEVLDIVPSGEELLIDARISPADIDEVRDGLPARVIMTGYSMRTTPTLEGRVRKVSADRIVDPRNGEPYYLARIELPAEHIRDVAPHVSLKPGMPADVMIMTGDRTLLDYLIEPITASFRKSFNEN
jgi:HlyD family secretion protein